ncbi:MAG: TrmH family RNA methyltransferase [Flavobacteriales bacterium]
MQKNHRNTININTSKQISILIPSIEFSDNIGGLFRLADAMGVKQLYFGQEIDINSRKLKKASRSTQNIVPFEMDCDAQEVIQSFLKKKQFVFGLEITEASQPINQLNLTSEKEILLIIGHEVNGIDAQILASIPKHFHIKMYGSNSSMNVITATSMALYHLQNFA